MPKQDLMLLKLAADQDAKPVNILLSPEFFNTARTERKHALIITVLGRDDPSWASMVFRVPGPPRKQHPGPGPLDHRYHTLTPALLNRPLSFQRVGSEIAVRLCRFHPNSLYRYHPSGYSSGNS